MYGLAFLHLRKKPYLCKAILHFITLLKYSSYATSCQF
jgi:hypothetical protein